MKIMKKVLYLFMCFLSYGLVSCEDDYEFNWKEDVNFNFVIEASNDLLSYSNPIAIYTDNFGVTDTIELAKENWSEIPESNSTKYSYKILKHYDFLPANNKLEIQFAPNEVYPEDSDSFILYSNIYCITTATTKEGKTVIGLHECLNIDIDINTEGTESDANENWDNQLKKKTRLLEIGLDKSGNFTTSVTKP